MSRRTTNARTPSNRNNTFCSLAPLKTGTVSYSLINCLWYHTRADGSRISSQYYIRNSASRTLLTQAQDIKLQAEYKDPVVVGSPFQSDSKFQLVGRTYCHENEPSAYAEVFLVVPRIPARCPALHSSECWFRALSLLNLRKH